MSPDDPRHGTRRGYYAHRKDGETACIPCKRGAASAEARRHMPGASRRVTPHGTARRIQALVFLGWTYLDIQRETGLEDAEVRRFAIGERAYVYSSTVAKVDAAYRRLCMTIPPAKTMRERQARSKARRLAERNGWVGPLAWDDIDTDLAPNLGGVDNQPDPVVVARILAHDASLARTATPAERRAVVAAWPGSLNDLERLTGWRADRYIEREEGAA